jgi:glucose/mannose-6-phosphate isomerase
LAIVASYSGNTEETLSLLDDVLLREANVVAITSGGTLADMAEARSVPCVAVPAGMVPRASLGYVLGGMMGILMSAGVADPGEHLEEAVRIMADVSSMCDMPVPTVDNPAKRLAHEIHGFVPVVVGHGLSIPVGKRWANQLNENAKSIAFSSQLPEMDHNEIVFWSSDPRSQGFAGVFLDHDVSDARMASRLEATRQMICGRSRAQVVKAIGDSPLAQMLSLVQLGDYVSFYSAVLKGEDPSTTEPIESLKKIIAKK